MSASYLRDVFVIGIGSSQFGRFLDRPFHELGAEAVGAALRDAAISPREVEVAYGSRVFVDQITSQVVLRGLGITAIEMINVENACAGGATAVRFLWQAVATGTS